MATQNVRPDPDSLERQHQGQQRHVARRRATLFALVGALVIGGVAFGISTLSDDTDAGSTPASAVASPSPIPSLSPLPSGSIEPGRYAFTTFGPSLDASYRITIDVPTDIEASGDGRPSRLGRARPR